MLLFKNTFFTEEINLKNFSQLTFNRTFKKFKNFLFDDAFLYFDKRLTTTIREKKLLEEVSFTDIFRKELIEKYNKQIIDNLFNFYNPKSNEEKLDNLFEENSELTSKELNTLTDQYFSNSPDNINFETQTILQITSFNEQLVFFIKHILQTWLIKQNKELNEKKTFFPGKDDEELQIQMVQDIYINEGMRKTFSINYKLETKNYKINEDLIKKIYYNDLSMLEFFNLNENYKRTITKNHIDNKDGLQFFFGNIYFIINTKQSYIVNDLENLMTDIGINTYKVETMPSLDDKENYLTMSLLQLFKLNLGYTK